MLGSLPRANWISRSWVILWESFNFLEKKVEDYQKENVGEQDNIGIGDDLTLNKETKSDMEILNGEGVTVGVSN